MGRNRLFVAVFGAAVALLATGAFFLLRGRSANTTLPLLPRDVFLVVEVDQAHLRRVASLAQAQSLLAMQGPEARAKVESINRACGFDPFARIDTFGFAMATDTGGAVSRHVPNMVGVFSGSFSAAEASRCLAGLAPMMGLTLTPAGNVGSHPVQAPQQGAEDIPGRLAVLDHRVVAAATAYMPTALDVVDGRAPNATENTALAEARRALGGDLGMDVLVDFHGLAAAYPRDWARFQRISARPGAFEASLRPIVTSLQTLALGVHATGSRAGFTAVLRYGSGDDARTAAQTLQGLWTLAQTQVSAAMPQVTADVARSFPASPDATATAQMNAANQAINLVIPLARRVAIRQDGTAVRIELDGDIRELNTVALGIVAITALEERRVVALHYCYQAEAEWSETARRTEEDPAGRIEYSSISAFVTRCETLPSEAAHCAIPSYALAHGPECRPYAPQVQAIQPTRTPPSLPPVPPVAPVAPVVPSPSGSPPILD